jgi:hypothetical protein
MPNEPSASTSTSTSSVAAVPTRYGCNFGQIVREAVTALLALAIAFVALWLLYDVHGVLKTGKPDNYDQHKEVLLLALGLLGTVIGYYFGRVPAERHADTARDAAKLRKNASRKSGERPTRVSTTFNSSTAEGRRLTQSILQSISSALAYGQCEDVIPRAVTQEAI